MITPQSKKIIVALGILVAISFGVISYLYKELNTMKNPTQMAQDEVIQVVAAVGKLMVLPTNEEPTVASVTDPEKLKGQDFFVNAKVGDKVLIYQNNRKAILYSPTINKIIEVSPISMTQNNTNTQTSGITADTGLQKK